ncbi:MAG: DUF421 domain-containing protein [Verrucomicrobiales bacterium]|nr:DUF421 domain-containing protein [Verrucomicrobiales bacterium]
MLDWIISDFSDVVLVGLSTLGVFSILVLFVRISGLRSFAKMSIIDFASTIAIGSVLASTIVNKNPSILLGGLAVGFILLYQSVFAKLINRFSFFDGLVTNQPVVLMEGEQINRKVLKDVNMSEADLMAKLREANVIRLSQVKYAVLETTGDVSVLHSENDGTVDDVILKGVCRSK